MKSNFKYLIGFIAGLAVALIILVRGTPGALATMQDTTLAQGRGFSDSSLRVLATCLSDAGFVNSKDETLRPEPSNPDPSPNTSHIDAKVIANDCLYLREEGAIEQSFRCMKYGEVVQVQLKDGNPNPHKYGGDDYVFVISYKGDKGWAAREYLRF